MSEPSLPHEAFIKSVLLTRYDIPLEIVTITKPKLGQNNHVYMITLSQPTGEPTAKHGAVQVLAHPIPKGTSRLVFRIPRAESNLEDSIRIRNEVSLITLARDALTDVGPSLVPRIYGWKDTDTDGTGATAENLSYIIEEFVGGEAITGNDLKGLDPETRAALFKHIARVVKAFQTYSLPEGITGFGGVTFDDTGKMTSTKCVFGMGGPFSTYKEFLKGNIMWKLERSEAVSWLNGWREDKAADGRALRDRIDNFIANGLSELLEKVPESKLTLIHGDLLLPNLHFDRPTNRLTGIIDFDFARIGCPLSEFMDSFLHFQGLLVGMALDEGERDLLLAGYKEYDGDAKYAIGHAWEAALAAEGVTRPSQIPNADLVSNLWWFAEDLCEGFWEIPRLMASGFAKGREATLKAEAAERLEKYLVHWGC
ncbi:hypothetical protein NLG97_g4999 [Lecanicillium saksenae]|uniref:Uncharacterized protein n=1 Tax=Lecanicillium saksenae TaxID=468837 RepID=A0ACC1QWX6_9HYPO|nr:hypothetical protein NLG97_g4999 [Lecanicillium saksenae]